MYLFKDGSKFREGIASAGFDANLGANTPGGNVTIDFLVQKIWEKYRNINIDLKFANFRLEQIIPDAFEPLVMGIISNQITNQIKNISDDVTNKSKIDQIGNLIIDSLLDKILDECKNSVGDDGLVKTIENFWEDINIIDDATSVLEYYTIGLLSDHTAEEESQNNSRMANIELNLRIFAAKIGEMIANPLLLVVTALSKNSNALLNHSVLGIISLIVSYLNLGNFVSYVYNPRQSIKNLLKAKWDDGVNEFISASGLQQQIDEENERQMQEYENNMLAFVISTVKELMGYTVVKGLMSSGYPPDQLVEQLNIMSSLGQINFFLMYKVGDQWSQGTTLQKLNKWLEDNYIYFNDNSYLLPEWKRIQELFMDKFKFALGGGNLDGNTSINTIATNCARISLSDLKNYYQSKSVSLSPEAVQQIINNKNQKENQKAIVTAAGAGALTLAFLKILKFF